MFNEDNSKIIDNKMMEVNFLKFFNDKQYAITDVPLIEQYYYTELTQDDLSLLDERSMWHFNNKMYSIRYDFTDSVRKYVQKYNPNQQRACYAGPIVRKQRTELQFGIEVFDPNLRTEAFNDFMEYIDTYFKPLNMVVLGSYRLLDDILELEGLKEIKPFILKRNVTKIIETVDKNHPVVKLLTLPPKEMTTFLITQYGDLDEVKNIHSWITRFEQLGIIDVYIDITKTSKFSYYNSLFFSFYQKERNLPLAAGGLYMTNDESIGFALYPENGVMK